MNCFKVEVGTSDGAMIAVVEADRGPPPHAFRQHIRDADLYPRIDRRAFRARPLQAASTVSTAPTGEF
jgi:hypothetical protein